MLRENPDGVSLVWAELWHTHPPRQRAVLSVLGEETTPLHPGQTDRGVTLLSVHRGEGRDRLVAGYCYSAASVYSR